MENAEKISDAAMHSLTDDLVERMKCLPESARVNWMAKIGDYFCRHCGTYHADKNRPCQCWNDE